MCKMIKILFTMMIIILICSSGFAKQRSNEILKEETKKNFEEFNKAYQGKWRIRISETTGLPERLYGFHSEAKPGAPQVVAKEFLDKNIKLFRIRLNQLGDGSVYTGPSGKSYVSFQQMVNGIPVYGGNITVSLTPLGEVTYVNSSIHPIDSIEQPIISMNTAREAVRTALEKESPVIQSEFYTTELVVYPKVQEGIETYHVAWKIDVTTENPFGAWRYFIDAVKGDVLAREWRLMDASLDVDMTCPISVNEGGSALIEVQVKDESGNPVENVTVEITATGGVFQNTGSTGISGNTNFLGMFLAIWLAPGPCEDNAPTTYHFTANATFGGDTGSDTAPINELLKSIHGNIRGDIHPENPTQPLVSSMFNHVRITLRDLSSGNEVTSHSDQTGNYCYEIPGVPAQNYHVTAGFVATYEPHNGGLTVVDDDKANQLTHERDIDLTINNQDSWDWTTIANSLDERNMYYHVTRIYNFFRSDPVNFDSMDYDMNAFVRSNLLDGSPYFGCNAGYNGVTDDMYFGRGGTITVPQSPCIPAGTYTFGDFALSSDIIYHEFTHGVVDHIYQHWNPPFNLPSGAVNEAIADYFACSINGNSRQGEGISPDAWVRDLDNQLRADRDLVNEVHCDSRPLSGALWDVRGAVGRGTSDLLVFESMTGLHPIDFLAFYDAILHTDDDNNDLSDGTPHFNDIITAFHRHGIGIEDAELIAVTIPKEWDFIWLDRHTYNVGQELKFEVQARNNSTVFDALQVNIAVHDKDNNQTWSTSSERINLDNGQTSNNIEFNWLAKSEQGMIWPGLYKIKFGLWWHDPNYDLDLMLDDLGFYEYEIVAPSVSITWPTFADPADAGKPGKPKTIYPQVTLVSQSDENLPTYEASDFIVIIGSQVATVSSVDLIFNSGKEHRYRLTIQPPDLPEGLYSMQVSVAYGSDIKNGVVKYFPLSPIEKGLAWLRSHYSTEGNTRIYWRSWDSSPSYGNVGITSLAVLSQKIAGYDKSDPIVRNALNYITSRSRGVNGPISSEVNPNTRTYETSMALLALDAFNLDGEFNQIIESGRNYLTSGRNSDGGWRYYANYGYSDLSVTQWPALALHALDYDDLTVWNGTRNFAYSRQTANGEFLYGIGYGQGGGGITAAGLWVLLLHPQVDKTESHITNGFNWLNSNYNITCNPGYTHGGCNEYYFYYLYSLAKACQLREQKLLGTHDWYSDISSRLISLQYADGHWQWGSGTEGSGALATAFALLSLQVNVVPPNSKVVFAVHSPMDLHVYDPSGRHTGYDYSTGTPVVKTNIPNSAFEVTGDGGQLITIDPFTEAGRYTYQLLSTGSGPYTFTITTYQNDQQVNQYSYTGSIAFGQNVGGTADINAIEGQLNIFTSDPSNLPTMALSPDHFTFWGEPSKVFVDSFLISETSGQVTLRDISIYSNDLSDGQGNIIPKANITVSPAFINNIPAGQQAKVRLTASVPANTPRGIYTGPISISTLNAGTKAVMLTIQIGIPDTVKTVVIPSLWYGTWVNSTLGTVRAYIGNMPSGYTVNSITPSSIKLNETVPIYGGKYRIISLMPGFMSAVMEVAFSRQLAVQSLKEPVHDSIYTIIISGDLNDGKKFVAPFNIILVGPLLKSSEMSEIAAIPADFRISQNYPNPFNPETDIEYALPVDCQVKLAIYNLLGQKVKALVNEPQTAGYKTVHWNGKDEKGNLVTSGIYFYKINAGEYTATKKMVMTK